jgi:diguanylate cyclase (GGDEF)-like protein
MESDQSLSDGEQTMSDTDQTVSETDQTSADQDQIASDHDQAASDRDYSHGVGSAEVHRFTRELRARSTLARERSASERVRAATARDAVAHARDLAADARDKAAALRDRDLALRDAETMGAAPAEEVLKRATADRAAAASSRARAAADREQAARDRQRAGRDRAQARADREALLGHVTAAETDGLTGARTRDAGLGELEIEIDRAQRMEAGLVVAYVDVVGLKIVNDSRGHGAGDAMLQRVVTAIRRQLRSYDLIVRIGGDEFLCALSGATQENARERFAAVQAALATGANPSEIKVGFATLSSGDQPADLIERADAELPITPRREFP